MIQTIKAVHFDGTGQSCDDLLALFGGPDPEKCIWKGCTNKGGFLRTVSGTTEFSPGDWIVVEPDGSTHVLTDHFTLAGRKLGLVPSMLLAHLAEEITEGKLAEITGLDRICIRDMKTHLVGVGLAHIARADGGAQ